MQKSIESRLERKAAFSIYYYFPFKASFNVKSNSAPAFPPPPRAVSPPRRGQCSDRHRRNLRLRSSAAGSQPGACCEQSRSRPGGRLVLRMLNHSPLASSHCTCAPRLRPAPHSPRPCPAGHRRARKPSFSVTDTHIHFVLMFPTFGTSSPRPGRTRVAGLTPSRLGFLVSLGRKLKKAAMSNFQSWEDSQAFLCHASLLSRRAVSLQLQLPLPKNHKYPYLSE